MIWEKSNYGIMWIHSSLEERWEAVADTLEVYNKTNEARKKNRIAEQL